MIFSRVVLAIAISLMIIQPLYAASFLTEKEARAYLANLPCEFSAYVVYKGETMKSMMGSLSSGQVKSLAVCAQSLQTKGAKPHRFCYLRGVDMMKGVYRGKDGYGSMLRDESGTCSAQSLKRIFEASSGQLAFKVPSKQFNWVVVDDKFGVGSELYKVTGSTPPSTVKQEPIEDAKEEDERFRKLLLGFVKVNCTPAFEGKTGEEHCADKENSASEVCVKIKNMNNDTEEAIRSMKGPLAKGFGKHLRSVFGPGGCGYLKSKVGL